MAKAVSSFELTLENRLHGQTLTAWLYGQLRLAIIEGRLQPGTKLPASRDFAKQFGVSRGTVVSVLERLQSEGYVSCRVGSGTRVSSIEPTRPTPKITSAPPAWIRRVMSGYVRPKPWQDLQMPEGFQPFCMRNPAVERFPLNLWGKLASRRARSFGSWATTVDNDGRGYRPLREAIAQYLSTSRGVRCAASQVVVVSGAQQALDLLVRFLLKPGDPFWMEDPGYFGATIALQGAGARIIPVPVDQEGLSVAAGLRACPDAKGAYVTPAHQFPLGVTMSLERRMQLLDWASRSGAFLIEDDYDSEYRFEGTPVPVLQGLDRHSTVILIGSFNKLLFPWLRIGYLVLPPALVDIFVALRYRTDFHNMNIDQVVLCDFIVDGHLGRHLRRMRDLYACRLEALQDGGRKYLKGLLDISDVRAGLFTAAFLRNGMTSREAEMAAAAHGVEVMALDRYALTAPDTGGVLMGFSAFDEKAIRAGLIELARAWG